MWQICLKLENTFLHAMNYYAVHIGRKTGVYKTWKECEEQVKGFPKARYKKFSSIQNAQLFCKTGKSEFSSISDSSTNSQSQINLYKTSNSVKNFGTQKRGTKPSLLSTSISLKRKRSDDTTLSKVARRESTKENEDQVCPVVYTDGACSMNGRFGSKAGYGVWWGEDHPLNLSCKLHGEQTNQRAEIAAVSAAVVQAKDNGYKKILIKTDSQFVISCLTEWAPAWKRRGWVKSDGKPVVHKKEFIQILDNMKTVEVKFEHVLGHRGTHGNEMADQLAVAGAKL